MTAAARALSPPEADAADPAAILRDIERLEQAFAAWDAGHQSAVRAYRESIDAYNAEAFRRLIRAVKAEPAALAALRAAVADDLVYAVLRHHGLLKPSLQERVETALDSVRPLLASHGGSVELVRVVPPATIEVRFLGACQGCPASALTFHAGVKKAVQEHCPEIAEVREVKGLGGAGRSGVSFVSTFALSQEGDWHDAAALADIPEGGVLAQEIGSEPVILSRNGEVVSCFQNACAHLGMPLDAGEARDGILTCPYHGFQYALVSGECLTAPEVQLQAHAVRVIGARVEVRLAS